MHQGQDHSYTTSSSPPSEPSLLTTGCCNQTTSLSGKHSPPLSDFNRSVFLTSLPLTLSFSPAKGRVVLKIPYEFEVTLTVVGDDFQLPWRLLNCEILVGQSFPGISSLHFIQLLYPSCRLSKPDSFSPQTFSSPADAVSAVF